MINFKPIRKPEKNSHFQLFRKYQKHRIKLNASLVLISILFYGSHTFPNQPPQSAINQLADQIHSLQSLQLHYWKFIEDDNEEEASHLLAIITNGLTQSEELSADENFSLYTHARPKKLFLKNGLIGLWKSDSLGQYLAFVVSQILKANMVPVTVLRERNKVIGTLQLYINDSHDGKNKNYDLSIFNWFDDLIFNTDRKDENMLSLQEMAISVDHDHSFDLKPPVRLPPFFFSHTIRHVNSILIIESKIRELKGLLLAQNENPNQLSIFDIAENNSEIDLNTQIEELQKKLQLSLSNLSYQLPKWESYQLLKTITDEVWKQKLLGLSEEAFQNFLSRKKYVVKAFDFVLEKLGQDIFPIKVQKIRKKISKSNNMTSINLKYTRIDLNTSPTIIKDRSKINLNKHLDDGGKCNDKLLDE